MSSAYVSPIYSLAATQWNLIDLVYSSWAYLLYMGIPTTMFVMLISNQFIYKTFSDVFKVDVTGWLYYYNDNA